MARWNSVSILLELVLFQRSQHILDKLYQISFGVIGDTVAGYIHTYCRRFATNQAHLSVCSPESFGVWSVGEVSRGVSGGLVRPYIYQLIRKRTKTVYHTTPTKVSS